MSDDRIEEGDLVRFANAHHAMNSSLKGHEGDLGIVIDTERGWSGDKTSVRFLEGSSKKVIDRWDIKSDRIEPAEGGPWTFKCGMCGEEYTTHKPGRCPDCNSTKIRFSGGRDD